MTVRSDCGCAMSELFTIDDPEVDVDPEWARFCRWCGYDQSGALRDQLEGRCSECGGAWRRDELLAKPPPGLIGQLSIVLAKVTRKLAFAALLMLPLLFVIGLMWPAAGRTSCCGRCRVQSQLKCISISMMTYAAEHGNAYPDHAATLISSGYITSDEFLLPGGKRMNRFFGAVDLEALDESPPTAAALELTIVAADQTERWYRVGDFYFARLGRPCGDRFIMLAWTAADANGLRWASFEDGHIESLDASQWPLAWQADAQARVAMKFPAIQPPP
jgi:hypothetical protein